MKFKEASSGVEETRHLCLHQLDCLHHPKAMANIGDMLHPHFLADFESVNCVWLMAHRFFGLSWNLEVQALAGRVYKMGGGGYTVSAENSPEPRLLRCSNSEYIINPKPNTNTRTVTK